MTFSEAIDEAIWSAGYHNRVCYVIRGWMHHLTWCYPSFTNDEEDDPQERYVCVARVNPPEGE